MHHIIKDSSYGYWTSCSSIFQHKARDSVTKIVLKSLESDLFDILHVHFDLIVASETIHEENNECPVVPSIIMSILGNENKSFGHAY